MPDLKKLEIGESITLTVAKVTEVQTGKWPEYHWHGTNGVIVVTPKAAADRQLEKRLKMTLQTVEQETITIHRAPNLEDATKSWWNFDIADGAQRAAAHAAPPKRLTEPTRVPGEAPASQSDHAPIRPQNPSVGDWRGLVQSYGAAWQAAVDIQGEHGTADSYQAGAATLLIAAQKANIAVPPPASRRLPSPDSNSVPF